MRWCTRLALCCSLYLSTQQTQQTLDGTTQQTSWSLTVQCCDCAQAACPHTRLTWVPCAQCAAAAHQCMPAAAAASDCCCPVRRCWTTAGVAVPWRRARSQRPTCRQVPRARAQAEAHVCFCVAQLHMFKLLVLGPHPGSMHIAKTAHAACISQAALRKPLLLLTCLQSAAASP